MAQIQKGTTYITGDQVTAANLNALADSAILLAGAITDQTAKAVPLAADTVLIHSAADTALRKSTLTQLFANATGIPISTGISGLGSGVATFLGTPSSANLAAAVSDETGSGALVFATSPTLVTPNLGAASATSIAASGTVTGSNLSGTNTGDQTTITGNAGSATILQTARNINGVSFNGSADITVTAAAGTLTGATLASGVTASSLTSLGTIGSLVATTADINGGTIDGTTVGASTPSTGAFTTLSASGNLTVSAGVILLTNVANTQPLRVGGATTSGIFAQVTNTGGDAFFGMERSAGNEYIAGSTGYDTIVRAPSGIAFSANNGTNMQMRLSSSGLQVTGALSATGQFTSTATGEIFRAVAASASDKYGTISNTNGSLEFGVNSTGNSFLTASSGDQLLLTIAGTPYAAISSSGVAVTGALSATGSATITGGAAIGQPAFQATGNQASQLIANLTSSITTAGSSFGLRVAAGTNASDYALRVLNQAGTLDYLFVKGDGAVSMTGALAIGNTVNTVSPTSPNRTITMVIGGTTYYIHAKTTND